ncbi:conserved hypothetical protein [Vibrio phage 142E35-1]|nr:conserved hypothetical protein [Vibrio phage 142E35-1]
MPAGNKCNSGGGGSGFVLIPNPPVEGLNLFTADTKSEAETLRDNYFSLNQEDLDSYEANTQKMIMLIYGGSQFFQNRTLGVWVDTFNSASSAVDLTTHSVTDLGDVTDAGSGKIITDEERSKFDTSIDWMLTTDVFTAPVIAYPSVLVDVNSSGSVDPVVLSGSEPVSEWSISSGSIPAEFSLDSATGTITYATSSTTSSGSVTIVATNPAGDSAGYVVNWEIRESQGAAEFLNVLNEYPFMRVTTSNSIDSQVLIKQQFHGRTSSTSNGTIVEDSAYPIYAASNGDGTWNYLLYPQGYSYWNLYVNCSTDPATLSNGLVSDITTSLAGAYDLVAQASNDVTVNGVNYPSDRSDIHWGAGLRFINFGQDSSMDNFMTDAGSWSYGFKLEDDWPDDGMGRGLFTRDGRNWLAVALGHSGTYSEMIYGNGSSRSYDSQEVTTIPSGGFSSGSFVRFTFTGSVISMYVDGVKYYDYSVTAYWDGSSANVLDVQFSNGVNANYDFGITAYNYTKWQGLISRLWIANGTVISSDDDGVTYPTGTTHAWDLNETTGSEFSPSIGSVSGSGMNEV